MKKYLISFACILIAITFVLTGCSKALFKDGPESTDPVVGNGGYAVIKGDYLYFTNAFISKTTVEKNKNKYGEESVASIYRTKLTSSGNIALDTSGNPLKAEILVKQIGGFENSNLYIFGDYLYYTSPKTLIASDKTTQTGLIVFNRIKLDGSSHKEIYVSSEVLTSYTISEINGTVYFISYASNTLSATSINEKGKVKNYTLGEDITSYVAKSGSIKNENEKFVYITKTINLNDDGVISGNKICKIPLSGGDEKTLLNRETYTLTAVVNNKLYYTISSVLYSNNFAGTLTQYGYNPFNNYKFLAPQNNEDMGIVATITTGGGEDTNLMYVSPNGSSTLTTKVIATKIGGTIQILGLLNQAVIYAIDTTIYIKSIFAEDAITITTSANLTVSDTTCFDYDTHNIYLFEYAAESNSVNYYLHMLKTGNDSSKVLIGNLYEADIPKEEE